MSNVAFLERRRLLKESRMIPSVGRIVHYRLSEHDALAITQRRDDARRSRIAHDKTGAVVHVGNPVKAGDVYPMLITRIWAEEPTETTAVQGQVFLDGNDNLWVTSVQQGDGERQWSAPPRV